MVFNDEQSIVFSKRLKELREKESLSQEKLLEELTKLGIKTSLPSLKNYEVSDIYHSKFNTVSGMNVELLFNIAEFYNVSIDYLLGRSNCKSAKPEMQWAIKYIGISEESITKLHKITHFNPNGSTDLDTEFADTLNSFIQSEWFSELIVNLMMLKMQSEEFINTNSNTSEEYCKKSELNKECRLFRYEVSELIIYICNQFDRRNNDG